MKKSIKSKQANFKKERNTHLKEVRETKAWIMYPSDPRSRLTARLRIWTTTVLKGVCMWRTVPSREEACSLCIEWFYAYWPKRHCLVAPSVDHCCGWCALLKQGSFVRVCWPIVFFAIFSFFRIGYWRFLHFFHTFEFLLVCRVSKANGITRRARAPARQSEWLTTIMHVECSRYDETPMQVAVPDVCIGVVVVGGGVPGAASVSQRACFVAKWWRKTRVSANSSRRTRLMRCLGRLALPSQRVFGIWASSANRSLGSSRWSRASRRSPSMRWRGWRRRVFFFVVDLNFVSYFYFLTSLAFLDFLTLFWFFSFLVHFLQPYVIFWLGKCEFSDQLCENDLDFLSLSHLLWLFLWRKNFVNFVWFLSQKIDGFGIFVLSFFLHQRKLAKVETVPTIPKQKTFKLHFFVFSIVAKNMSKVRSNILKLLHFQTS